MDVKIFPSVAQGDAIAPPSKSFAHRLLICAALSEGTSKIINIGTNDDICATVECLKNMGAQITLEGDTAIVKGIKRSNKLREMNLFCNESGSTLRFLIPLSLVFCEKATFTGAGRLMQRPQSVYEELFKEEGCYLSLKDNASLVAEGEFKSGIYKIRGDVSSQFITGLLFTLPLLDGDSKILLTTPLQSKPYIDITLDTLRCFGIEVSTEEDTAFFIKGNQCYKPCNITVEGDWSNAAFLDAFNLINPGVTVNGLNPVSSQGDRAYKAFYEQLKGGTPVIDITHCPDLGPVLITCAVLCNGAVLKGTKRLKIKESDRGEVMKTELQKFGVVIDVGEDEIVIPNCTPHTPDVHVNCHNDHRIAMSFAVLCSVTGGTLSGAQCVNKSFPGFFESIKSLGIKYEII